MVPIGIQRWVGGSTRKRRRVHVGGQGESGIEHRRYEKNVAWLEWEPYDDATCGSPEDQQKVGVHEYEPQAF